MSMCRGNEMIPSWGGLGSTQHVGPYSILWDPPHVSVRSVKVQWAALKSHHFVLPKDALDITAEKFNLLALSV